MAEDARPEVSKTDLEFVRAFIAEQDRFRASISMKMLGTADSYLAAASLIGRYMEQTGDSHPSMGVALCQSLAVEIYFKALVTLQHGHTPLYSSLPESFKKQLRKHELPELFRLMAAPVQQTLVRMFGIIYGTPHITIAEFTDLLTEHASDIFYSWRYLYEYDPGKAMRLDLTLLSKLINAARLTVDQYQQGALDKWGAPA